VSGTSAELRLRSAGMRFAWWLTAPVAWLVGYSRPGVRLVSTHLVAVDVVRVCTAGRDVAAPFDRITAHSRTTSGIRRTPTFAPAGPGTALAPNRSPAAALCTPPALTRRTAYAGGIHTRCRKRPPPPRHQDGVPAIVPVVRPAHRGLLPLAAAAASRSVARHCCFRNLGRFATAPPATSPQPPSVSRPLSAVPNREPSTGSRPCPTCSRPPT
jgi:hypothetical protein